MQVCRGKQQHAARRRHHRHVRLQLDVFLQLGLRPRVLVHVRDCIETLPGIPFLVVVDLGIVRRLAREPLRMEGHGVAAVHLEDRNPPVDLAHRRRIPGVAVRMEGIGDAAGEVIVAGGRAHARHVEIGLFQITADVLHHLRDDALAFRMMNEGRLELRENLGEFLDRIVILRRARIQTGEGLGNQLAGQLDQRQRMLIGGIHEQIAVVDHPAAAVVVDLPVKVDSGHGACCCNSRDAQIL